VTKTSLRFSRTAKGQSEVKDDGPF